MKRLQAVLDEYVVLKEQVRRTRTSSKEDERKKRRLRTWWLTLRHVSRT